MKKIILIFTIILVIVMSACSSKQEILNRIVVDENKIESTYDLNVAIKNAKCITEYPDTATIEDFDTVIFGRYEQDGDESNGKEDIEWCIIERTNDSALLISKYILDCKKYNDFDVNISWKDCSLREWLNNNFLSNAFSYNEKNLIEEIDNSNNNCNENFYNYNRVYESTMDKVFLLSTDEIGKYFINKRIADSSDVSDKRITTKGTNYAKNKNDGCCLDVLDIDNEDWEEPPDYMYNGNSTYWSRSIGCSEHLACAVFFDGFLKTDGNPVNVNTFGVRPAIWVKYK